MEKIIIIKVDVDGTIVKDKFPEIGEPLPMAIYTIKKLKEHGYRLILWTCREGKNLSDVIDFLEQLGIVFDVVNEGHPDSPFAHLGKNRKPYAHYHIDDKNFGYTVDWQVIHDYFFIEKKYHEQPAEK